MNVTGKIDYVGARHCSKGHSCPVLVLLSQNDDRVILKQECDWPKKNHKSSYHQFNDSQSLQEDEEVDMDEDEEEEVTDEVSRGDDVIVEGGIGKGSA